MRYFLFFLLTASAFAQPARQVHLRLLAFDNTAIPPESFVFDAGSVPGTAATEAPIKDYLNREDTRVVVTGSELVFTKSANLEDLKKPENQLAKVTLPKKGSRFILIFLPDGKGAFRVMPLDDSVRDFPLGAYRVISLSSFPVRLTLEGKSWEFKPGDSSLIQDPPMAKNYHSSMYAFSFVDGKWGRIGSGLWPAQGKKRSIQMFYDNPVSQKTELRGFSDLAPPKPGQEAEQ